jgi:hypothetical protein
MMVTTLGLTQIVDASQLTFPLTSTVRPGTNTSAGYIILRFNDSLQGTTPVYFKVDFGTGSVSAGVGLWITPATGATGSGGTLTGAGTKVSVSSGGTPVSTVTNYTTRGCYNATQGAFWIDWKQNAQATNTAIGGFGIYRSVDNTGAPTGTAIGVQGNGTTSTFVTTGGTPWQWYNASSAAWVGPANSGGFTYTSWAFVPFGTGGSAPSTLEGTAGQVFPAFQYAPTASVPGFGVTNQIAMANLAEITLGSTVSLTILGSTTLTYIAGQVPNASLTGVTTYTAGAIYAPIRIWQ